VTIKHSNLGGSAGNEIDTAIYLGGFHDDCSGWTIERNYIHHVSHYTMIQGVKMTNALVQYNLFKDGWGKETIRGQLKFSGNTIRYNRFHNACGQGGGAGEGCTAEIAAWGESGSGLWDNNRIYGNWFYLTRDMNSGGTIVIGGNGSTWSGSPGNNNLVFNNTFAGYSDGWMNGYILLNGGSGNV